MSRSTKEIVTFFTELRAIFSRFLSLRGYAKGRNVESHDGKWGMEAWLVVGSGCRDCAQSTHRHRLGAKQRTAIHATQFQSPGNLLCSAQVMCCRPRNTLLDTEEPSVNTAVRHGSRQHGRTGRLFPCMLRIS